MTHINLIPRRTRQRNLWLRRIRQWAALYVVAAAALIAYTVHAFVTADHSSETRRRLEHKYEDLRKKLVHLREIRSSIDLARQDSTLPDSGPSALSLLGIVSGSASAVDDRLYIERFAYRAKSPADANYHLELHGAGLDNISLATFVASLRDYNVFDTVQLKSAGAKQVNQRSVRTYSIECSF